MTSYFLHVTLSLIILSFALATPSFRQAVYHRNDITGTYQLSTRQSDHCSETITILGVTRLSGGTLKIPHSAISENGHNCTGSGSMLILRQDSNNAMRADELTKTTTVSAIVDVLVDSGMNFFLGFEQDGRSCGDVKTPASTVSIFLREKEATRLIDNFNLFSSKFKYMIVYKPRSEKPCIYSCPIKYEINSNADQNIVEPLESASPPTKPGKNPIVTVPGTNPVVSTSPVSQASPSVSAAPSPGATVTPSTPHHDGHNVDDEDDGMFMSPFEDDGPACFPGDATVVLEDGSTKRMDNLSVGDRVMVGFQEFAPVFMFTHRDSGVSAPFVYLVTADGRGLYLTSGHYLYVNRRLVAAKSVRKGDILQTATGDDVVATVGSIVKRGLYNPQTTHGDIIVDSVRASTYTTTVERKAAHALLMPLRALLMPLRALFRCTGYSINLFNGGADSSTKILPSSGVV